MMEHSGTDSPSGPPEIGFAPKDLTDGKAPGEWRSRYETAAWKWIVTEAVYLFLVLVGVVFGIMFIWLRNPAKWWGLTSPQAAMFSRYGYAWLGGTLGGVLFSMKWLYHAVAKWAWHLDRSGWRYLTPHISGGVAFGTVIAFNSIMASEQGAMLSATKSMAIGFLVGLFSDNALAKLNELAETLLGPTKKFHPASKAQPHENDQR